MEMLAAFLTLSKPENDDYLKTEELGEGLGLPAQSQTFPGFSCYVR